MRTYLKWTLGVKYLSQRTPNTGTGNKYIFHAIVRVQKALRHASLEAFLTIIL